MEKINKIYFITGASGSGKTTTIKTIEANKMLDVVFCYFDSIGVPTKEEMEKQYGSGENWQKAITSFWVKKIIEKYLNQKSVILDGQMRLSFIVDTCKENNLVNYEIILFDCNDEERSKRLINREHPESVNPDMMNWAKYLRNEARNLDAKIIDNTNLSEEDSMQELCSLIN
jgi:adenylate kinase family enzyme